MKEVDRKTSLVITVTVARPVCDAPVSHCSFPQVSASQPSPESPQTCSQPVQGNLEIGRRVVDVSFFLEALRKGCSRCGIQLCSDKIEKERTYGLASLLTIRCEKCGRRNNVPTGKQQRREGQPGVPPFDVNQKAAVGEDYMSRFLLRWCLLVFFSTVSLSLSRSVLLCLCVSA